MKQLGVGIAVLLVVACGGSTVTDDGRAGSAGSGGGAAAGGTGATGGMGGMGGTGGTGGSSGTLGTGGFSAGGVGGFGGTGQGAFGGGGGAPAECDPLSKEFAALLPVAKQCNPFIDFEQCTVLVPGSLPCGCPTFVSSGQQLAVSELGAIAEKFEGLGCALNVLCEACAMPLSGSCQLNASGSSGNCVDHF